MFRAWGGVRGVDGLWEIAKPMVPPSGVRPQGGRTQDTLDETLFAAIVYVLVSGCAWRHLPPCFGISESTAHRRFLIWSRAGVWGCLHEAVLHQLDDAGLIDVTRVVLETDHVRAEGGEQPLSGEPSHSIEYSSLAQQSMQPERRARDAARAATTEARDTDTLQQRLRTGNVMASARRAAATRTAGTVTLTAIRLGLRR